MPHYRRSGQLLSGTAIAVLVAVAAACAPEPPPPLPPPPPVESTNCAATVGIGSAQELTQTLSPDEAAFQVAEDVARADGMPESGELRVVIAEMTDSGLDIRSEPVATLEQATGVARDAAAGGTVVAVDLDSILQLVDPEFAAELAPGVAIAATDPERPRQWALDKVPFEAAWDTETGRGVVVAVVDTGVDGQHPDLASRLLPGADIVGPNGVPVRGGQTDTRGHGTHVAGTIGAVVGNSTGISGAVKDVRILPVKVFEPEGGAYAANVARGIVWAADNGARVINLSLGGPFDSAVIRSAITYAKSSGIVIVAAGGNDGRSGNPRAWPAANPDVIAVSATTSSDTQWLGSTSQSYIAIAAPGDAVLSTVPGGQYRLNTGSSMAAPHVAAAAALLKAKQPGASPETIRNLLLNTARDLGAPGWDRSFGCGLVDPAKALALQAQS